MLPLRISYRDPSSLEVDVLYRGHDIRTVQELLGHRDVSTTMIYTHILRPGARRGLSTRHKSDNTATAANAPPGYAVFPR